MLPVKLAVLLSLPLLTLQQSSQVTRVDRRNVLLARRKRYLSFPMNSNFVITLSVTKPLMVVQPRGFITLGECDVPFALPSDTRLFKKHRRNHYIQRREVYSEIEDAFTRSGFNGNACLRRMICESRQYIDMEGKSLVKDLLSVVFTTIDDDEEIYRDACETSSFSQCAFPFLDHILNTIFPAAPPL